MQSTLKSPDGLLAVSVFLAAIISGGEIKAGENILATGFVVSFKQQSGVSISKLMCRLVNLGARRRIDEVSIFAQGANTPIAVSADNCTGVILTNGSTCAVEADQSALPSYPDGIFYYCKARIVDNNTGMRIIGSLMSYFNSGTTLQSSVSDFKELPAIR